MSFFSRPAGIRTLSHLVQYWPRVSPVTWAPSLPQSTHETNNTPPYDFSRVSPALRSKNKKKKGRRKRKTRNDETCSQLVCLHVCNMAAYLLFLCPSGAHVAGSPADRPMPSWISEARAPRDFTCLPRAREAMQPITFRPLTSFDSTGGRCSNKKEMHRRSPASGFRSSFNPPHVIEKIKKIFFVSSATPQIFYFCAKSLLFMCGGTLHKNKKSGWCMPPPTLNKVLPPMKGVSLKVP